MAKKRSFVKKLGLQWDLRMGPYRAFFPTSDYDLSRCRPIIEASLPTPKDSSDYIRQLVACENTLTSQIVACLYIEDAQQMRQSDSKTALYNLFVFSDTQLSQIAILSHLTLSTTENKATVSQLFLSHCFIEVLKAGGQAMIISCDVGYFSIYKNLGLRPIGSLTKKNSGEMVIPMIFLPDREYLSVIGSPILRNIRGANFEAYQQFCSWYYNLLKERSDLTVGAAIFPEDLNGFEGHQTITEGMSDAGVQTFLKKAMVIDCRENEVLLNENNSGRSFGFIQNGVVKIVVGGKTVVLLSKGDIFGEIAFLLNTKRTAQVVAASDETEVVLFDSSVIDSLADASDRAVIWHNLAKVLAKKLVITTRLLN